MREKSIKYSVRIPTYNRENLILGAVRSVIEAANKSGILDIVEIIIVDDGSTDNTFAVVSDFINVHSEVQICYYRFTNNSGVAVARNEACKRAKGIWLVDLDSDDKLLPEAFEIYENYINMYPDAEIFAYGSVNSNGKNMVHVKNKVYISNKWTDYFYKNKYYDGEFQHVLKKSIDEEFPFIEGVNGGEGIKWYLINKKYYNKTVYTETVTRYYNTLNTDSLMRSEKTEGWLDNAIKIGEYRLSVMEDDLKKYSPRGKDGLAMSYAILGGYYIKKGDIKQGLIFTRRAWNINIAELRVYRNILMILKVKLDDLR